MSLFVPENLQTKGFFSLPLNATRFAPFAQGIWAVIDPAWPLNSEAVGGNLGKKSAFRSGSMDSKDGDKSMSPQKPSEKRRRNLEFPVTVAVNTLTLILRFFRVCAQPSYYPTAR